jgi:hypothetical protein
MRGGVVGCLLLLCVVGCFPKADNLRPAAIWDRMRGAEPDGYIVRSVLLDRPIGDAYLNRDIWSTAARPVPHELATLLAQNGLRVGLFTGVIPGELSQATTSATGTVDAMDRHYSPNRAKVLPTNGPLERTQFRLLTDLTAAPTMQEYTMTECGWNVTIKPADGERLKLTFEPQIQHGDKTLFVKPTADQTALTREDRKPLVPFPTLTFEVTLGANDYLILGPTADPAETLGGAFFITPTGEQVRQRVMVLRASQKSNVKLR